MVARLRTKGGDAVADVYVPDFETGFPPALQWGVRFFLRLGDPAYGGYVETFCYVATRDVTGHSNGHRQAGGDGPPTS